MMNCRLCGSDRIAPLFRVTRFEPSFEIWHCADCGFRFREIDPADAYGFYGEGYYSGGAAYNYQDERRNEEASRLTWIPRVRKLASADRTGAPRRFLDVGCSFGGLLRVAREAGYEPWGVEVSDYSGGFAAERFGHDRVVIGSVESVPLPREYFSVATMVEVIEHLYDPVRAMDNLYQSLRPGGVLLVQTADIAGLQAVLAGPKYHYYLPGHLSYFTRENLARAALQAGFSRVRFYGGCEFGLLPKLRKSRRSFKTPLDYLQWLRISLYHLASLAAVGPLRLTSAMVMLAWKDR